jgi:hypothetical protein
MTQYKLGKSTIIKIWEYDQPERSRVTRTGRPSYLTDRQVNDIIEYNSLRHYSPHPYAIPHFLTRLTP